MNKKVRAKIIVDLLMTAALLLLMPYEMIGEDFHEWVGVGMFFLFVTHHILNRKWTRNLLKGKYTPFRIAQTILVALILASMLGSMFSGIILSRHVFSFMEIRGGMAVARTIHMAAAYWGFVLMSLHLGFHWSMLMGVAHRRFKGSSAAGKWMARIIAAVIAGYGLYAFIKRDIGSYMLLQVHFVFFDYEEPVICFILDYAAAMGLLLFIGHYLGIALKTAGKRQNDPNGKKKSNRNEVENRTEL